MKTNHESLDEIDRKGYRYHRTTYAQYPKSQTRLEAVNIHSSSEPQAPPRLGPTRSSPFPFPFPSIHPPLHRVQGFRLPSPVFPPPVSVSSLRTSIRRKDPGNPPIYPALALGWSRRANDRGMHRDIPHMHSLYGVFIEPRMGGWVGTLTEQMQID